MKKKLVAITSVILVSLGATMTIASQSHDQLEIEVNQTQGLSALPTLETKEVMKETPVLVENPTPSSEDDVVLESNEAQKQSQDITDNFVDNQVNNHVEKKPTTSIEQTNSSLQTPSVPQSTPTVTQKEDNTYLSTVEQLIYQKVNEERQKAGMSPLSYNQTMQKYARDKSADMGNRGYFSHEDLEGQLITASMQQDGLSYNAWGENIAYISRVSDAQALANQFMTNWMNSEGHRANILSSNFSSIGVGVYEVNGKVYATQEFYR